MGISTYGKGARGYRDEWSWDLPRGFGETMPSSVQHRHCLAAWSLYWTLLTLIPVSVPVDAEPFDVPVYQTGLEELREQVIQQDKHSHLLQNILSQMVSLAKRLEASTQPLALACGVGDSMALGVLARFGVLSSLQRLLRLSLPQQG